MFAVVFYIIDAFALWKMLRTNAFDKLKHFWIKKIAHHKYRVNFSLANVPISLVGKILEVFLLFYVKKNRFEALHIQIISMQIILFFQSKSTTSR